VSAFVECPACNRRLVQKSGIEEDTFKSYCPHDGCGAALLCTIAPAGALSISGPTKLREAEMLKQIDIVPRKSKRSSWASTETVVPAVIGVGTIAVATGLSKMGAAGLVLALLGTVAFAAVLFTIFWLAKRRDTKPMEGLREIDGALEPWTEPEGYRG